MKVSCTLVSVAALLPFSGSNAGNVQRDKSQRPNIVLVIADDMGWGDVGYQGAVDVSTPNIDALARRGVQFSQGYVSCSISGPSRAGILTGVYQQRFGFYNNLHPWAKIPEGQSTLGEMVRDCGYATGFVGKWHMADSPEQSPNRRGFDQFYGFWSDTHDYYRSTDKPGVELYDFCPLYRNGEIQPPLHESGEYITDCFTREAVEFIDKHASSPFLLCLSYNAVHSPWQVPEHYVNRLEGRRFHHEDRKVFAAMVLALDDGIGRVMESLRKNGLEENTLFILISDNGSPRGQGIECSTGYEYKDRGNTTMSSPGPFRGYKADTYEGGIRVPYIMSWPSELPQGMVYDNPVISLDIFPTVMQAVGGTSRQKYSLDGVSLLPYLKSEWPIDKRPHSTLYWRRDEDFAIRKGDWKLVYNDQGSTRKIQLFDMKDDKEEVYDLSGEYPELADSLLAEFDAWDAALPPCTNQTTWNGRVVVEPKEPQPVSRNFRYKEGYRRKVSEHNRRIYDAKYRRSVIVESFKLPYKGK